MTAPLEDLEAFLAEKRDAREYRRALAVKMALKGYAYDVICDILTVTPGFVSQAKKAYETQGVAGLLLKYTGSQSFLRPDERESVLHWLKEQQEWSVETLKAHIEETYGIVFQSRQSYYDLFAAAKITWKKAQRTNPGRDPAQVAAKKKEISELLQHRKDAIAAGDTVVLYVDECHLLWDDARGYVWSKANQRVTIPMKNYRERQTYYGAIEHISGEVTVMPFSAGNGASTVAFIKHLRKKYAQKKLILLWDGATYHTHGEMVTYLQQVNAGQEPEAWTVTCVLFAPHAPEQNPIEDIWLRAKQCVRKNWRLCDTFRNVKRIFQDAIDGIFFHSEKLRMYSPI